jgi:hypothetical protein
MVEHISATGGCRRDEKWLAVAFIVQALRPRRLTNPPESAISHLLILV